MTRAVGPVAADGVLLGDVLLQGVRIGGLGQRREERRIEHRHVWHVRQQPAGDRDALYVRWVVQRGQGCEPQDRGLDVVVDERGLGEYVRPLHNSVSDADHVCAIEIRTDLGEQPENDLERLGVALDRLASLGLDPGEFVADEALVLPDALNDAHGDRLAPGGVDELVLHGGGSRVQHEDRVRGAMRDEAVGCCGGCHDSMLLVDWAWMAVMATVLTMSWTSAPRERSFTGLRRPWRTGPIATAPDERCTAL